MIEILYQSLISNLSYFLTNKSNLNALDLRLLFTSHQILLSQILLLYPCFCWAKQIKSEHYLHEKKYYLGIRYDAFLFISADVAH